VDAQIKERRLKRMVDRIRDRWGGTYGQPEVVSVIRLDNAQEEICETCTYYRGFGHCNWYGLKVGGKTACENYANNAAVRQDGGTTAEELREKITNDYLDKGYEYERARHIADVVVKRQFTEEAEISDEPELEHFRDVARLKQTAQELDSENHMIWQAVCKVIAKLEDHELVKEVHNNTRTDKWTVTEV